MPPSGLEVRPGGLVFRPLGIDSRVAAPRVGLATAGTSRVFLLTRVRGTSTWKIDEDQGLLHKAINTRMRVEALSFKASGFRATISFSGGGQSPQGERQVEALPRDSNTPPGTVTSRTLSLEPRTPKHPENPKHRKKTP